MINTEKMSRLSHLSFSSVSKNKRNDAIIFFDVRYLSSLRRNLFCCARNSCEQQPWLVLNTGSSGVKFLDEQLPEVTLKCLRNSCLACVTAWKPLV